MMYIQGMNAQLAGLFPSGSLLAICAHNTRNIWAVYIEGLLGGVNLSITIASIGGCALYYRNTLVMVNGLCVLYREEIDGSLSVL